jgi:hypothetical protein
MYNLEETLKNVYANLGLGIQRRYPTMYAFGTSGFPAGRIGEALADAVVATAGPVTLTPDQMFCRMYRRDCGAAARSDTTPTAANWIRALRKPPLNLSYTWTVYNNGAANTVTILPGTGVTIVLTSGSAATAAFTAVRNFRVTFTNVTPGSEAVEMLAL